MAMQPVEELARYVQEHAVQRPCTCSTCLDHLGEAEQPVRHTADVIYFQVSASEADGEKLRELVTQAYKGHFGNLNAFDGDEHSYLEVGGWIGDQGLALSLMGLGSLLGLWKLRTPRSEVPGLIEHLVMQAAGMGMVTIQANK